MGTLTDSSTSAGATVTNNMANAFAQPTLAASNATSGSHVTYTNSATVYIANAPTAGSNVNLTNPYALDVAAGTTLLGGGVTMSGLSSGTVAANSYIGLNSSNQLVLGSGGGGGGTITLGTSASATNPQRTSEAGTGFYSATDKVVSVAANGVQVEQWNTVASGVDYFSLTPGLSGTNLDVAVAGATTSQGITFDPKANGQIILDNNTTTSSFSGVQNGVVINGASGYPNGQSGIDFTIRGSLNGRVFTNEASGGYMTFFGSTGWNFITQYGGDSIYFGNGFTSLTATDFQVLTVNSAVDWPAASGGVSGNPGSATISAQGSDTNVTLKLVPKGSGFVNLTGTTTGTNADFLCLDSSGDILLQSSSCTISKRKSKENFTEITGNTAYTDLMALSPMQFNFKQTEPPNPDKNFTATQYGLIAEDVYAVDPKLSVLGNDGKPQNWDERRLIALLVKGFQMQQDELEASKGAFPFHKCFFNLLVCPN